MYFYVSYDYIYRPKQSFGQGNIFTPVCHSVHRGGGLNPNFQGGCVVRGVPPNFPGGCLQFFGGSPIFRGVSPIFRGVSNFSGGSPIFQGGLQFLEYGKRSAGTHPTGTHSCLYLILTIKEETTASLLRKSLLAVIGNVVALVNRSKFQVKC